MYLTSLHVVDPTTGREGFNAFYYRHGPFVWNAPPPDIPDGNPGELMESRISVPSGGNRVRSFLDVVAPDEATLTEIRHDFVAFVGYAQRQPFPWDGIVRRCRFRVGVEHGLVNRWHREIADLYRSIQAFLVPA